IEANDGPFKTALDRTKYVSRHDTDPDEERSNAQHYLVALSEQLGDQLYLFGPHPRLADLAILPFIRQFANVDRPRFDKDAPANLREWLDRFLMSERFNGIMQKYPMWKRGDEPTAFCG
ncbi:glutathione S-transferase C-terminal domain-containing protein, partial [Planktotalea sp.]|uniref:glutathione S-transferase C-terminal domain-containing protein n=1 Tax=Planktotalea sp. TaxID=2029877 RepID=UPI0032981354